MSDVIDRATTALELAGALAVTVGVALLVGLGVAAVAPPVWGWPAGLIAWGGAAVTASALLVRVVDGAPVEAEVVDDDVEEQP